MSDGVIGETTVGCVTAGCTSTVDLRVIHRHSGTPANRMTSTNGHEPTDPEGLRLVRGHLRALSADLATAVAASDHDDWAAMLQAVRLIQGRAAVTRGALDRMLGSNMADDVPPLVRAVGSVRRLIAPSEVDSFQPDELRARMHAVLHALDRELLMFLGLPKETPLPEDSNGVVRRVQPDPFAM